MLYSNQVRVPFVFLAALAASACGSGSPATPTQPYAGAGSIETVSGPPIAAHSTACWEFNNTKAGAVSADVTPRTIHLILGVGKCNAAGQVLAEKDGELVNVNAPAEWIHVTLSNQSDVDVPYILRVAYFH